MPVKRVGILIDLRAPRLTAPQASRASLDSTAPTRLGPQNNWPHQAIAVAATTTWAILMIRLTVTQFILARAYRCE